MSQQTSILFPEQRHEGWRPPEVLPDLTGVDKVGFDTEYDGENFWTTKPAGISVYWPGHRAYLPVGHQGGGNLDEGTVKRWALRELRDKSLVGLNVKDDLQVMLNWGVDLEAQGCRLRDVAFNAALLDEHRYSGFSLASLAKEYLHQEFKEQLENKGDIWRMPSWMVGGYAEQDAFLPYAIDEATVPALEREDLLRVLELENDVIFVTAHMERSGALIDRPKLERWRAEVRHKLEAELLALKQELGFWVSPDSQIDLRKLFDYLKLPYPEHPKSGATTFDEERISSVQHPTVQRVLQARKYKGLLSKYLDKYLPRLDANNILRFQLHQLRGDEYGTITGRYSSSRVNIQQVPKVENQIEEGFVPEYLIRELFIPEPGCQWFSSDASQIEFRLFAHYSGSPRLIGLYNENPDIDFHQIVADMIHQRRGEAKHNNFGKLYGMGLEKLANRLGLGCDCGCGDKFYLHESHTEECPANRAIDIADQYDEQFPEAKRLLNQASKLATERGYVRTYLGRRRRYPKLGSGKPDRPHSALNAVVQGTAGDLNKLKLRQVYRERKSVGIQRLRLSVHDEADGDVDQEPQRLKQMDELFNDQLLPLKVRITWKSKLGANWRETA